VLSPSETSDPEPLVTIPSSESTIRRWPCPPEECIQFGKAFWRVQLHLKSANPHLGPVYFSKIDIADGFYCIWVRASDVPKLGVLFPSADGEDYLVGSPLALPIGWTESLKIFTAATETIADLTNDPIAAGAIVAPHPLEVQSEAPAPAAVAPTAPVPCFSQNPCRVVTTPRGAPTTAHILLYGMCMLMIFLEWFREGYAPGAVSNAPFCAR
jgi:hypothetical protein